MRKIRSGSVVVCVLAVLSFRMAYGHSGDPDPSSTFDIIQHRIFNQSCALQSCHGANAQAGGLVLEEGQAYNNLINTAPNNPVAKTSGKARVLPGDLDRSFLWQKITASLSPGEGSPMPLGTEGLAALNPELANLISKWILAGAPEDGVVEGTGDGGGGSTGQQPKVDPLPPPAAGQGFQVKVGPFPLGSRPEMEGCLFVRLPNEEEIYISGYEIAMHPGSHHFIVYRYDGDACDQDGDGDGIPNCLDQDSSEAFPAEFTEDIGCNDQGPADRFRKSLIAGSQTPHSQVFYPQGIALKLKPHQGLLLNSHYINHYSDTQGEVWVNLYTTAPQAVEHEAKILFDVIANTFIDVAPFTTREASWAWSPSKRIALIGLSSHMHKRGTLFTIDYVGAEGADKNPADGPVDPQGRRHLYVNTDYADPANVGFDPPLILEPGERLAYTCSHDNGVERPVKMGCEETASVPPGAPLDPARACSTDADCVGFGTGHCVPAKLVFGFTSNDEMCIMPGLYYELAPEDQRDLSSFSLAQITHTADNPATSSTEESFTPSLSGDGRRMAFASTADPLGLNPDGSLEVFTIDLSSSPPTFRQITRSADSTKLSGFPVLSNDGATVAFTSTADLLGNGANADGNVEVFVANFDGTNLRQLTQTPTGTNGPSFSNNDELLNILGLALSGDGSLLIFTSTAPLGGRSGTSQEIFRIRADGTDLRQLTQGTSGNSVGPNLAINGIALSRDGSRIVFSSTGNYTGKNGFNVPQIFTMTSEGEGLLQLTNLSQTSCEEGGGTLCIGVFVTPSISDDGKRLGFLRLLINLDNLAAPELQNTEPFIMNADGGGLRQLFDAPSPDVNCFPPSLSQDGNRVTFICLDNASQQGRLYINDALGEDLQPVTELFSGSGLTSPPSMDDSGVQIAFVAGANLTGQNSDGNAEIFLATQAAGGATATLENPKLGSAQSGIGVISGWACDADRIDIIIDEAVPLQAAYGTSREDTRPICSDVDNGFALLLNWNLLKEGSHTVRALADGLEFARVTFAVTTLGQEFLAGVSGTYALANFPSSGTSTMVRWEESLQNFVIAGESSDSAVTAGVSGNGVQVLENPRLGSAQSGIGIISGWACDADRIDIIIDDAGLLQAAYGTSREDTRPVCGDADNGFALLLNWNLLGEGSHTIRALADGLEFAQVTVDVATLGQEFLTGISGEYTLPDFPQPGTETRIRWEESLQNFIVIGTQ